jgi:hypothetical protein
VGTVHRAGNTLTLATVTLATVMLAGCASGRISQEDLFPPSVGDFLRVDGPAVEATTEVDFASYQGPPGAVTLRIRQVGAGQVDEALAGLPPLATEVGHDPALGVREGVFFTYSGEYHAAWGNGDWVFVVSSTTDTARRAFLASYGF